MTDYNAFTDRIGRNYAVRRAEEAEHQQAMRPQQRSSNEPLIYKTYHSPAPQPQQSTTVTMDQQTQDAWNDWAVAHVVDGLRAFAPQINKEFDALIVEINEALRDLREALAREREKNITLRSDIEVLRVMVRSQNAGVTRSKRDVT